MLLQTNSYIVPKDKRAEHARICRRFRQTLLRLGCDHFEVYEQVGSNWSNAESTGRYVQILRFTDRKHQLSVQAAERTDPTAQAVIAEFCDLINFPYQQQQGLFAVGFYTSVLPASPKTRLRGDLVQEGEDPSLSDETVEEEDLSESLGEQEETAPADTESTESFITGEAVSASSEPIDDVLEIGDPEPTDEKKPSR